MIRECLTETPDHKIFNFHVLQNFKDIMREAGNIKSKLNMFHTSIVEAATWICGCHYLYLSLKEYFDIFKSTCEFTWLVYVYFVDLEKAFHSI